MAINKKLTIGTPTHLPEYDFDLNGVVNVVEQSVELQFDSRGGFMEDNAGLNGLPTKTTLVGTW